MFEQIDFIIFGIFLLLSIVVGVYHGIKAKYSKYNHSANDEYLTGGHNLPIIPTFLSLLTTFVSGLFFSYISLFNQSFKGITILGTPAEVYHRGASMTVTYLAGALGFLIVGLFFIPTFYKIRSTNVYKYFQLRFSSKLLRSIGTVTFIVNTSLYMAVVIYAPAIALSGAAKLPLSPFIIVSLNDYCFFISITVLLRPLD